MSFEFVEHLVTITIVNFVVVFPMTIGILYLKDKITEKYFNKDGSETK